MPIGLMRQFGSRLAICALWLQIALSFGHMHPQDVWGAAGFRIGYDAGAAQISNDHRQQAPDQSQADLDEDGCFLCASMALLGSAVLPDAVKLPVPQASFTRHAAQRASLVSNAAPSLGFQPRAPPYI